MSEAGKSSQLNKFNLINDLSEGAFARVYLVLDAQVKDR
jgi:hypothetical protein